MLKHKQGDFCEINEGKSVALKNINGSTAATLHAGEIIVVIGYRGASEYQKNPPYLVTTIDKKPGASRYVTRDVLKKKTKLLMNEDIIYTTNGVFAYKHIHASDDSSILPSVDGYFHSNDLQGPRFEEVKNAEIQFGEGQTYQGILDKNLTLIHCTVEYIRKEGRYEAEVTKIIAE